jgi:hypothetical protein
MTEQQLARLQGGYYLATGLWPLIHMKSFLAVTGPKRDLWLVRTVGILVSCIGGHLLQSAKKESSAGNAKSLAVSSAAGLGAVDTWYSARGVISPIYLLDTAVEAALIALWARAPHQGRTRPSLAAGLSRNSEPVADITGQTRAVGGLLS